MVSETHMTKIHSGKCSIRNNGSKGSSCETENDLSHLLVVKKLLNL